MTCGAVPRLVAAVCAARVRAQVTIATACGALGGVLWQGRLIKSARTHTVTMPRRRRSSPSTIRRLLRCRHAGPPRADASSPTVGGEPVSPEAAGPLPRARSQAETARSGDASHPRAALRSAGLALDPHGGQARHADPLASSGLAAVLVVEVAARTAADSEGLAATHRTHGPGESNLG